MSLLGTLASSVGEWFGTGHERRAKALAIFGIGLLLLAAGGTLSPPDQDPELAIDDHKPEGNTLIALQGYHDEGGVVEVNPDGEVVWAYDDADDVFDVEVLGPDRVQLAVAEEIPDEDCPERFQDDGFPNCVRNALRIVEKSTNEVVWEYAWYDVERHEHEVHDADHYETAGEDGEREDRWAIADTGNDRVFAVNRSKAIVWEWNASDDYDRPDGVGPEDDWTHLNDVDRLGPGVFQVSLRNFDTVVELHVAENGSVRVEPVVGPDDFETRGDVLYEQHNPDRLADGHLLVADSERNRVVEIDLRTGEKVWVWGGSDLLHWPRDADRLPNGHTLATDSYGERVVEVDDSGEVVWAVETGRLPYEADRVPADWSADRLEGSADRPTAPEAGLPNRASEANRVVERADWATAMAKYVLPVGVHPRLSLLVVGAFALLCAVVEGVRGRVARRGAKTENVGVEADD